MAAFSRALWAISLRLDPARAQAFGLGADHAVPRLRAGRPKSMTPEFERLTVKRIDALKRDRRALEGGLGYGDECGDADAIRCFMVDQYHERLLAEGHTQAEAGRLVTEYAASPEFERHVRSHKVALSKFRHRR